MRYKAQHNEVTRERILAAASMLFREHGVAATGLAQIMAEVDLTVGTFYTHFESKEDLLQAALHRSQATRRDDLAQVLRGGGFEAAVRAYLGREHRDAPGTGCPIAALAPELARHPEPTRQALTTDLEPTLDLLAAVLSERRGEPATCADAAAFFGLLVGTLQLARATPDRARSDAILDAGVRAALRLAAP